MLIVLALSVTTRGRAYLWCASMEQAVTHCCCPSEAGDESHPQATPEDCCEAKVAPPMTDAREARATELRAPVPLVLDIVLPRVLAASERTPAVTTRVRERGARAGPTLGLYDFHGAYLI